MIFDTYCLSHIYINWIYHNTHIYLTVTATNVLLHFHVHSFNNIKSHNYSHDLKFNKRFIYSLILTRLVVIKEAMLRIQFHPVHRQTNTDNSNPTLSKTKSLYLQTKRYKPIYQSQTNEE